MKPGAIVTGSNLGSPPVNLFIYSDVLFVWIDRLAANSRDLIGQQKKVEGKYDFFFSSIELYNTERHVNV